jgi:NTP pyrophosphatase (non-canonical NTP hydrolase)
VNKVSEDTQRYTDRYRAAYAAANGEKVAAGLEIEYRHGWFKLSRGGHVFQTVRRRELAKLCRELERRVLEAKTPKPDLSLDDYQVLAMRTAMTTDGGKPAPAYLGLGLTGEAGEIAEMIKKGVYHGHELNRTLVADELGDVLWYVAVMADRFGWSLSEVAERNIAKLKRRYPEGFSEEASRNREE